MTNSQTRSPTRAPRPSRRSPRVAGVSRATVSRVVNGSPRVSADVRRSVETAIDRARLHPQPRRPQPGHPPERLDRAWSSPSRPAACSATRSSRASCAASAPSLAARDVQLVLLMPEIAGRLAARRPTTWRPATSTARSWSASTATTPARPASPPAGVPTVVVGRPLRGSGVELRRRRQPRRRAQRRRPPDRRRPAASSRRSPARPTWSAAHRPARRISRCRSPTPASAPTRRSRRPADFTQDGGAAAMERLLAARPDIDAVFAASDLMAAGAMSRPRRGRPARARATSPSSATTTRRSPSTARPSSPASASRSRRWAGRLARLLIDARRGRRSRATARDPGHRTHSTRLERREAHALSRPATGGRRPARVGARPSNRPHAEVEIDPDLAEEESKAMQRSRSAPSALIALLAIVALARDRLRRRHAHRPHRAQRDRDGRRRGARRADPAAHPGAHRRQRPGPERRPDHPLVRRPRRRRPARSRSRSRRTSSTAFNASPEGRLHLARDPRQQRRGQHPQDADRGRQRAGHHRSGRRRGAQPVHRPAARPAAADRLDRRTT